MSLFIYLFELYLLLLLKFVIKSENFLLKLCLLVFASNAILSVNVRVFVCECE